MNPYQPVIDWLRSKEGEAWSEARMQRATFYANSELVGDRGGWHLNHRTGDTIATPLYLGGVLSIKEDVSGDGTEASCRFEQLYE